MTNREPIAGNLDELDCIFYLAPEMYDGDPRWHTMYNVIVVRLQREARGLPLDTLQQLLLERLANVYVTVKYMEATGGYNRPNEQKDANTFLLSLFSEWNKVLKGTDIEQRRVLARECLEILTDSLKKLKLGRAEKTLVAEQLGKDLEKAGWSA